jgi:hypothetical protein
MLLIIICLCTADHLSVSDMLQDPSSRPGMTFVIKKLKEFMADPSCLADLEPPPPPPESESSEVRVCEFNTQLKQHMLSKRIFNHLNLNPQGWQSYTGEDDEDDDEDEEEGGQKSEVEEGPAGLARTSLSNLVRTSLGLGRDSSNLSRKSPGLARKSPGQGLARNSGNPGLGKNPPSAPVLGKTSAGAEKSGPSKSTLESSKVDSGKKCCCIVS